MEDMEDRKKIATYFVVGFVVTLASTIVWLVLSPASCPGIWPFC